MATTVAATETTIETITISMKEYNELISTKHTTKFYKDDFLMIGPDNEAIPHYRRGLQLNEKQFSQLQQFKECLIPNANTKLVVRDENLIFLDKIKNETTEVICDIANVAESLDDMSGQKIRVVITDRDAALEVIKAKYFVLSQIGVPADKREECIEMMMKQENISRRAAELVLLH